MKRSDSLKGAALTLLGGASWGFSGFTGQYLFTVQGMDSRWLVPIRLGLAGIILFVFSLIHCGPQKTFGPWLKPRTAFSLILYGLFGVSFCQFAYFLTIQLSSAATATILQELSPVFILIASCLLARRRPSATELISIPVAILGVFLIVTHGDPASLSISASALFSGLVCAFCVMIYNVVANGLTDEYPVSVVQGWAFLMGSLFFTLVFHPWTFHYVPTLMGIGGIAVVVLIGNVVAFVAYIQGVRYIGPEKGILYGFAEPVTAAILSTVFLSTPFTLWDALGFAAIFGMLVLISKPAKTAG